MNKSLFFIPAILLFLLLIVFAGIFRTKYRCGELENIHALKQRFIQYDFIPFFKTKGKLLFTETFVTPYRSITVVGIFDDDVKTIIDGKYIHDIFNISSTSSREMIIFKKEEFSHISDELLSKYQIVTNFDGTYGYKKNSDTNLPYEFFFLANQVHCHFYLDQNTKWFLLSMSAR